MEPQVEAVMDSPLAQMVDNLLLEDISDLEQYLIEECNYAIGTATVARYLRYMRELIRLHGTLPVTADGVVVVPGMVVFYLHGGVGVHEYRIRGFATDDHNLLYSPESPGTVYFYPRGHSTIWDWLRCYSTREAAEKASKVEALIERDKRTGEP